MKISFNGEVVRQGDGFSVKIAIDHVPSQAQAQEIGKWLDEAVRGYFESKGARLTREAGTPSPAAGLILQH